MVVDSYELRADALELGGRAVPGAVVAVDDLERHLDVDLLVVPAGSDVALGPARRQLRGVRYALIDPSSSPAGPFLHTDAGDRGTSVLVSLGAVDRGGVGAAVADGLARSGVADLVRHVAGSWSMPASDRRVVVESVVDDLGPRLDAATVVVTAGGVTLLESLLRGRPTVVVPTAANQSAAVGSVRDAGAAVVVDPGDASGAIEEVVELLRSSTRRAALGRRGAELIDGRGADRVAEAVVGLL
ncbi:MAG: hypothetical protein JST64_11965 [Actinobacteria bacterium]|nr:hypothetical protein [Actinomycetota bacterium]